jgi:membrane protease YdiL (CAAX protease family)
MIRPKTQTKKEGGMILTIFLFVIILLLMPMIGWAQDAADPASVNIGQYSLPVILSVALGLVFKWLNLVEDRWKSLVAIVIGVILGYVALLYSGKPMTIPVIIEYGLFGMMSGAGAVGLYEAQRSITKPR